MKWSAWVLYSNSETGNNLEDVNLMNMGGKASTRSVFLVKNSMSCGVCCSVVVYREKRRTFPQNSCNPFTEAFENVFIKFSIGENVEGYKFFVHNESKNNQHFFDFLFLKPKFFWSLRIFTNPCKFCSFVYGHGQNIDSHRPW